MKVYDVEAVRGAPPPPHAHVNRVLRRLVKGSQCIELRTLCEKAGPGRETAKPLSADAEKLLLREDAIKQLEVHSQNAQKEFQKDKRWQSHGGALMPSRVG